MTESRAREDLTRFAKSLFDRGYSVGSSGNISVAVEDGILITPTNSCLGFLDPARIAKLDRTGRHVGGDKPSKEIFLHQAFYDTRPGTGAVVHLHSTYATALSCLADTDPEDAIPPLTPYVVMRVGRVKLLPYVRPGDPRMGEMIRGLNGSHAAVLLANHGPAVSAGDLATAVFAAEELEETAKLVTLLRDRPTRHLDEAQVQELARVFGAGR
ncbi:MAG: aldolase [Methylobacterium sp.]|uniref:3-oxo-tetronate 4-phosphate decarboxylase n=1 Tax=Methylobacterium sp. TaxID=409 RepID=UPI0025850C9F|nr:3-oxo-tetronate 4-phosphate decarboxylase [Methylobacterium sp.]MBY0299968.1 aldolase [Methylobacterium sp.]